MKHTLIIFFLLLSGQFMIAQTLHALTYNIRYDSPNDGENQWKYRKHFLAEQLLFHSPDVFGIQEGLHQQVQFLDSALTEYSYVGVGRDDGQTKGEYSAIYYKPAIFRLKEHSTFWLSETPQKVSVGWDAAMERICTYGLFQHIESEKYFWVFNTHFDHRGEMARKKSVELILDMINDINIKGYPVVLMGDLNLEPDHTSIKNLQHKMQDSAISCTRVCFGPSGTFNGFNFCKAVTRRIDYIFVSKDVVVEKHAILSDSWNLKYPSDHLPVFVQLKLSE